MSDRSDSDIRRYFGGSPQASKAADKNGSKKNGTGPKKKKKAVIESDSDDDIFVPKKKQAVKESPPKKVKKSPVKSPAKVEKKEVNIAHMFGAAPVKRTAPKTVTKPKLITIEDSDDDKQFENALMDLDEREWTNANSKEENPGKVKEDSSAKAASPVKEKTPLKADSSAEREKHGDNSAEKSKDKSSEREKHRSAEKEKHRDRSVEREKRSDNSAEKKRDRSSEREKHRDKSAEKDKHKNRSAEKEKHRDRSAEKEKHRDRSAEKEKHKDRSAEKEKHKDRSAEKEKHRDRSAEKEKNRDESAEKKRDRSAERDKHREQSAEKSRSVEIEKKTTSPSKTNNKESPQKKEEKRDESRSTNKPLNFANLKRKADSEVSPKDTKMAKTESVNKGSSSKPSDSPSTSKAPLPQLTPQERGELWVDKHKPTSLKQIIGQQGDNSNVQKLLRWLSSWHKNHGPGVAKKPARPAPWAKDHNGEFFKAALLSGPPGVGKTTTAHLVCKELGMDVVEFNASDTRSKKLMNAEVTELLSNRTLQPFFSSGGASKTSDKHVLVMDEVDGMAGNEDRGGMQELINLIKNSKCPVICMCNDRQHPKVRSLANYCFDLRFYKPRVEQIRGRMMSVCFNEKIKIKPDALDEVIIGANQDIRQVLHNLSMWCTASKNLSADQARTDASTAKKDIKVGPWDALRSVFSSSDRKNMTFMDKSDLFFTDYNIMPLFVQENYLRATPHQAKTIHETLDHVAKAALSLSTGDLIEKEIRSRNDAWSLLPVQAVFACVAPGDYMEGHLNGQIQFPAWLGKNSNRSKLDRFVQELQTHMRLSISGGKRAVNLEYLQHLQNKLVSPLVTDGSAGVPAVMQVMRDYFLTREDLDSILELNQWPGLPDPMARVESKVKAALTRAYNKEGVVTPYAIQAPIKKKAGGAAAEEGYEEDEGGDSEEEDDGAADAMIKAKPKAAEKAIKAAPSTAAAAGTSKRGSRGGGTRGRGRGRGK